MKTNENLKDKLELVDICINFIYGTENDLDNTTCSLQLLEVLGEAGCHHEYYSKASNSIVQLKVNNTSPRSVMVKRKSLTLVGEDVVANKVYGDKLVDQRTAALEAIVEDIESNGVYQYPSDHHVSKFISSLYKPSRDHGPQNFSINGNLYTVEYFNNGHVTGYNVKKSDQLTNDFTI